MTKDEYVAIIKSAAQTIGATGVSALLITEMPWLGFPIIKQIMNSVLATVLSLMINRTEFAIFFVYIDFRVNKQGRDFWDAAVKNHQAILVGKPEEKINAKRDLHLKFRALVMLKS